ncbi:MAG: shikimate dehydrogenase, partial [Bacteroidota bacterium]
LIGYPLSHSFSQKYFTEKFRNLGLSDCGFRNFELKDISGFPGLLEEQKELVGLSVTIPHKESILPHLHNLDDTARAIGAVNCIDCRTRTGYNTDAWGFRQAIRPFLAAHHYKALILGTGGASKAVAWALKEIGIEYRFVSHSGKTGALRYEDLNAVAMQAFPFIINTTPLGMLPDVESCPSLPYEHLTPQHFLFDLVYNPAETLFLKKGKEKHALCQNGLTMLQQQAEKAWEIWNT